MENNKKKILDEINNLYGDTSLSDSELELIEKVSENDEFTNEAIELMNTQRSKYNDIVPTKENETEDTDSSEQQEQPTAQETDEEEGQSEMADASEEEGYTDENLDQK